MTGKIEEKVMSIAAPIAEKLGYEIIDIEYNRTKGVENELIIYIDKDGGVVLDDCEKLSRLLDEPLDEQDPIPESYVLCVSSPGADRPLKKEADYLRALGKEVDIGLYKKLDGKKEFTGTLSGYDAETVTIATTVKNMVFFRKDIALIRMHVSFK